MNEIEIMEDFQSRSGNARKYREIAELLLVVSVALFAGYAVERARLGEWGGAVLAGAGVLAAVTAALAALSYVKLRCPNCSRVLGGLRNPAFCPACGAALRSEPGFEPEDGSVPVRTAGRTAGPAGRASASRRAAERAWEPRGGVPGVDPYPDEKYPKNIRMFTTSDEMELTKRYIRLIDCDNVRPPELESGGAAGRLPRSAGKALLERPSGNESRTDGAVERRGPLDFLSLETIIAMVAGGIVLTGFLIALIFALR
jgi:hypothetical protein